MDRFIKVDNIKCVWNYVARDEDGTLYLYDYKPVKIEDCGVWFPTDGQETILTRYLEEDKIFDSVQWSDDNATDLVLKLKKKLKLLKKEIRDASDMAANNSSYEELEKNKALYKFKRDEYYRLIDFLAPKPIGIEE